MILVTGAAGFIGFHLSQRLLSDGCEVCGVDNLNAYYDPKLKAARLELLEQNRSFAFRKLDIADESALSNLPCGGRTEVVIHLAAQAGVRHSIHNPLSYIDSNIRGFLNVLEYCRRNGVKHLIYASSSSVYGLNSALPLSTSQCVDHPVSLYGATKKANELIAHSYSHLYGIPTTGLRFFTVYGPWGRPDMAYYKFTQSILEGKPIEVFNDGRMKRDFTYIDDIVEAAVRVISTPAAPDAAWTSNAPKSQTSSAPYRLYNVGNHSSIGLTEFIDTLERCLGKKADRRMKPAQPGDVMATTADVDDFARLTGFAPKTPLEVGLRRFVDWYAEYHSSILQKAV
ncbi:MAG TPA: NAD-dependent epimerase [Opitutaceae bacterium]|jgi:UDP-glucuronate 4-epimerase